MPVDRAGEGDARRRARAVDGGERHPPEGAGLRTRSACPGRRPSPAPARGATIGWGAHRAPSTPRAARAGHEERADRAARPRWASRWRRCPDCQRGASRGPATAAATTAGHPAEQVGRRCGLGSRGRHELVQLVGAVAPAAEGGQVGRDHGRPGEADQAEGHVRASASGRMLPLRRGVRMRRTVSATPIEERRVAQEPAGLHPGQGPHHAEPPAAGAGPSAAGSTWRRSASVGADGRVLMPPLPGRRGRPGAGSRPRRWARPARRPAGASPMLRWRPSPVRHDSRAAG